MCLTDHLCCTTELALFKMSRLSVSASSHHTLLSGTWRTYPCICLIQHLLPGSVCEFAGVSISGHGAHKGALRLHDEAGGRCTG